MSSQVVKRWAVLGTALAVTVGAIFYPLEENPVVEAPDRPQPVSIAVQKQEQVVAAAVVESQWIAVDNDPFSPRSWVPPPPAQVAAQANPAVMAAAIPAPPPPPLPYKFVGQMRDGSNTVVYLSLGDQMVLARAGETLEGGYKVAAISQNQIDFESVALGVHQTLPIPVQD